MTEPARLAARDNAEWCDAVSRAHGATCRYEAGYWINPGPAPPFYPNLVTLGPDGGAVQREAVSRLKKSGLASFGVKDSFAALELADLGLDIAFEADWLWLEAGRALPAADRGYSVTTIANAVGLADWERAWGDGAEPQGIFPPALLADPRISFLALVIDGSVSAGAALNRSAQTVGLSNVFFAADADKAGMDPPALLTALLSAVRAENPGLAISGYEHGDSLALFLDAGFSTVGSLRVWIGAA